MIYHVSILVYVSNLVHAEGFRIELGDSEVVQGMESGVPVYPWFPDGHITILKNGDILLITNLSEHLLKKQKLLQNTQKVSIIFSKDYDQDYKNEVLESVQKKFKIQDLSEISFSRDSDIVGGVKIRVGNKIIDGSIVARINKIKESLISIYQYQIMYNWKPRKILNFQNYIMHLGNILMINQNKKILH